MTGEPQNGYAPKDVLIAVKRALWTVQDNDRVTITQVDLTLKTQKEAGAGFALKVPFLSDVELSAGATETTTQTIRLSFTLPEREMDLMLKKPALQESLEQVIATVKAMVDVASDGKHGKPILFKDSTATVEFVFDARGEAKLFFHAGLKANYANSVSLTFA
ncbi:hypothetical protein [Deinococcus ficus]|uniref:Uncharacterized protein n=1 Tax=Deinococcus ficus TaxID=317577 RepID=A0A221T3H1_9DEIO|nr:hypothetical protein [Deinococcus ficus]ASN83420.1 hypothetical protein DFI_19680 [Deinococcus ficus]